LEFSLNPPNDLTANTEKKETVPGTGPVVSLWHALVAGDMFVVSVDYRNAFLYALAFYGALKVGAYNLGERASDAAFGLAASLGYGAEEAEGQEELMDSDDDGEVVSPWEEVSQELPRDLKVLWQRYGCRNDCKFDTKHLL
jgi:hypothetical protein